MVKSISVSGFSQAFYIVGNSLASVFWGWLPVVMLGFYGVSFGSIVLLFPVLLFVGNMWYYYRKSVRYGGLSS